jgi:hypothetical protein
VIHIFGRRLLATLGASCVSALVWSGLVHAAAPASTLLNGLSKQVAAVHADLKSQRDGQQKLGVLIGEMGSRPTKIRARLRDQQSQISGMQEQLANINALLAKVNGKPVAKVASTKPASGLQAQLTAATVSASVAAQVATPVAASQSIARTPVPKQAQQQWQLQATSAATQTSVPAAKSAAQRQSHVTQTLIEWAGLGIFSLLVGLVVIYFGRWLFNRHDRRARNTHAAREAELRDQVSRKASVNTTNANPAAPGVPHASGQATSVQDTSPFGGSKTEVLATESVPEEVVAAVRDFDVYLAYGEKNAAREVLEQALQKYPDHAVLSERLTQLASAGVAVPAPAPTMAFEVAPAAMFATPLEQETAQSVAKVIPAPSSPNLDVESKRGFDLPSTPSADVLDFSLGEDELSELDLDFESEHENAGPSDFDDFENLDFNGDAETADPTVVKFARTA